MCGSYPSGENKRHELSRKMISAIREYIDVCVEERLKEEKAKFNDSDVPDLVNNSGETIQAGAVVWVDPKEFQPGMSKFQIIKQDGKFKIVRA
jgi:hypothetical protein